MKLTTVDVELTVGIEFSVEEIGILARCCVQCGGIRQRMCISPEGWLFKDMELQLGDLLPAGFMRVGSLEQMEGLLKEVTFLTLHFNYGQLMDMIRATEPVILSEAVMDMHWSFIRAKVALVEMHRITASAIPTTLADIGRPKDAIDMGGDAANLLGMKKT